MAEHVCTMTDFAVAKYLDTLAAACAELGEFEAAKKTARHALELPDIGDALRRDLTWRLALYELNQPYRGPRAMHLALAEAARWAERLDQAADHLTACLALDENDATALNELGVVRQQQGQHARALDCYRRAHRLRPLEPGIANNLAWLLLTVPDPALRDTAEALRLAEWACQRCGRRNPRHLDTLAAAYAASGDLPAAVDTMDEALRRLSPEDSARREAFAARRQAYRNRLAATAVNP